MYIKNPSILEQRQEQAKKMQQGVNPFIEFRDDIAWNLLCKARWIWHIEIKNRKNWMINYVWPTRRHRDIWPKGVDFLQYCRDLRCPECWKLLCRAVWVWLEVEIKCHNCKEVPVFKLDDIYNKEWISLPLRAKENLILQIKNLTK